MKTRHLRWISLCILAVAAAGCENPQAQQLLTAGRSAYLSGDDVTTTRCMNQFLSDNPRSSRADEAHYYRGLARYRQKDLSGAQGDFYEVVQHSSSGGLKALSQKAIADIAYDREDMGLALSMYTQALAGMDQSKRPVDEVRYRLGQTLQRLGRWHDADLQFDRLIYQFGDDEWAKRAARYIRASAWTIQVAALKDKKSADAVAARIATEMKAKYKPDEQVAMYVHPVQSDTGHLFAVQVGRFPTYDLAMAHLKRVRAIDPNGLIMVTK